MPSKFSCDCRMIAPYTVSSRARRECPKIMATQAMCLGVRIALVTLRASAGTAAVVRSKRGLKSSWGSALVMSQKSEWTGLAVAIAIIFLVGGCIVGLRLAMSKAPAPTVRNVPEQPQDTTPIPARAGGVSAGIAGPARPTGTGSNGGGPNSGGNGGSGSFIASPNQTTTAGPVGAPAGGPAGPNGPASPLHR